MRELEAADAAAAVSEWEDELDEIVSLHTGLAGAIDWHTLASEPPPTPPVPRTKHQKAAKEALEKFKPSVFHSLTGGTERRRRYLEQALVEAPEKDQLAFERAKSEYENQHAEWSAETDLARRVVNGEPAAYKEVLAEMSSIAKEALIGTSIRFTFSEEAVHAMPVVHGDDIVPNFRRRQLASGRLSESKMPAGQFNELYQDYVASAALKVAGDLFRLLPIEEVTVTCLARMLNPATGHKEDAPILSVQFVRETFDELSLENIDPSSSLSNFNHAMSFRKTKGFAPIEPLRPM